LVKKAEVNYWIDVGIGIAGLISAISGLVFLLPGNPTTGILGISYQVWNSVHTWSSLAMIAGVGAHLALHWKWLVSMTRRILSPGESRKGSESVPELAYGEATGMSMSRRAFLVLGGAATIATGLVVAGYKALFDPGSAEAGQDGNPVVATEQQAGVACPFGLISDPYPGRCRLYVDSNGDGICDYSVPGSGSNPTTNDEGSWGGGLGRLHRRGQ
jgi:hypothetical protein